tara:strand:+ start:14181 stop:14828 length:648 start_codon:yes stop_codon:yes gene_type:complete
MKTNQPLAILTGLLALVSLASAPAGASVPGYEDIHFQVLRNGTPFGEHIVRFSQNEAGELVVDIDIELKVQFGPLLVFHYTQDAEETWQEDELVSLTAQTLRGGRRYAVEIDRTPDSASQPERDSLADLQPSSHWRGYTPGTETILNTETGEPMPVVIEDLGTDEFETANGLVSARRLRMTGTLSVDLWYDSDGTWIGCEFEAQGQTIRYVLASA